MSETQTDTSAAKSGKWRGWNRRLHASLVSLIAPAVCLGMLAGVVHFLYGQAKPGSILLLPPGTIALVGSIIALAIAWRVRGRLAVEDVLTPIAMGALSTGDVWRCLYATGLLGIWGWLLWRSWRADEGKGPHRYAWPVTSATALALALIVLPPWGAGPIASAALDPSWVMWMQAMATRTPSIAWGKDVAFTYGPLGYLDMGFYHPALYGKLMAWGIWTAGLAAIAIVTTCRRAGLRPAAALVVCAGILFLWRTMGFSEMRLATLVGSLLVLYFAGEQRRFDLVTMLLAATLGIASLGKFGNMAVSIALVGAIGADQILRRRSIPIHGIVFTATMLAAWIGSGQSLGNFVPFVRCSGEVARWYGTAMTLYDRQDTKLALLAVSASAAMVLSVLCWRSKPWLQRALFAMALCAILLVFCKGALVRLDAAHVRQITTLTPLAVLLGAFAAAPASARQTSARQGSALPWPVLLSPILVLLIVAQAQSVAPIPAVAQCAMALPAQVRVATLAIVRPPDRAAAYAAAMARVRQETPLPPMTGTVDLYANGCGVILAHGLPYSFRPAFQSCSAYMPLLARGDADFLLSSRAPDNILFGIEWIDDQLPAMEDGPSWPALLARYDMVGKAGQWLQMRKRDEPRPFSFEAARSAALPWNESIDVADLTDKGPLWVKLDFRETLFGQLRTAAYKAPLVQLEMLQANGKVVSYRLLPGVTQVGFLLSPVVRTNEQFAALAQDRLALGTPERIVTIKLVLQHDWAIQHYAPTVPAEFSYLRIGR